MAGTFDFCPDRMVPRTKPPKATDGMSMNGWFFSSKPKVPFQKTFVVKLQGLVWYLNPDGTFDNVTNPTFNAKRLEEFYQANGTWGNFTYPHPHLGNIQCRFKEAVEVPEGIINSGGLVDAFDVTLITHNPGY